MKYAVHISLYATVGIAATVCLIAAIIALFFAPLFVNK